MMAPAWGAEVVSSNIVGYEKLNLTAEKFAMSAAQFELVGGGSGTLSDLFSATDIPYGTEIRFLNSNGAYEVFKYLEEAYDESIGDEGDFVPGWADVGEEIVKDPVKVGTGFWVKAPEGYDLTQAGQVATDATITLTLTPGMFEMVADPFPEGFNPNKVTWENLEYGTEIRVLNASGAYEVYKYLEEAYDESIGEEGDFVPGWANVGEELVSEPIADVRQGFWIRSTADKPVTITFTNPTSNSGN